MPQETTLTSSDGNDNAPLGNRVSSEIDENYGLNDVPSDEPETNAENEVEYKTGDTEIMENELESPTDEKETLDTKGKLRKKWKILEYDLEDMYPEMDVLIGTKKKNLDYKDPNVIRALWLEGKTNVVAEWKKKVAKINVPKKGGISVQLNHSANLRLDFHKQKVEQEQLEKIKDAHIRNIGKKIPHFESVQTATNVTTEMRYKFSRNNPPVPRYYIRHYDKYKKPPFKHAGFLGRACKLEY